MVNIADTADCLVIETYDKRLLVNIKEHLYELLEVDPYSIKCNTEEKTERKRSNYTPPLSHPWKKFSFDQYVKRKKYKSQAYK